MAHTTTKIGPNVARITGADTAVGAGAAITIGFNGDGTATIQLPAGFPSTPDDDAVAKGLGIADLVKVRTVPAAAVAHAQLNHVSFAAGPPAQWTLTNDDGANAMPQQEITVEYRTSLSR